MTVEPNLLKEISEKLEHGEVTGIANQLGEGYNRLKVNRELTTIKQDYDERIINAAIKRIQARGVKLQYL